MKSLAIIFFVVLTSLNVWAQATCSVPVCDIPVAIDQLKAMNQNDRAQTIKNYRLTYHNNNDPAINLNLKQYADAATVMLKSVGEETWVIREADYLQNQCDVELVEFAPIDRNNLIYYFDQMDDDASSFAVLNYWGINITTLENINNVLDLVAFGEHARDWSIANKKDDYITREAEKIITFGGQQVSRLNPFHEGLYKISVSCDPTPKDCGDFYQMLSNISIMDSLGARGLTVSVSEAETSNPVYMYTTAILSQNGTHVQATSTEATPWTRVSEFNVDIDMATGAITGTIVDPAWTGTIRLKGTAVRRISEYFSDAGPTRVINVSQVFGRYRGSLGPYQGIELVVSQYTDGTIVGVINDTDQTQLIAFREGSYNQTHGVLVLTGAGSANMGDRKLVLALRKDKKGKECFTGFMITDTPQIPVSLFYAE